MRFFNWLCMLFFVLLSCLALSACHSTTTIEEYSIIDGKPILLKKTVSDEHIVKSVDDNLRHKAVFTYVDGLHIGIEAKLDPMNGGTPTGEIKYKHGKFGFLTMPVLSDTGADLDTAKYIPQIVAAVDPDIAISLSSIKKKANLAATASDADTVPIMEIKAQ